MHYLSKPEAEASSDGLSAVLVSTLKLSVGGVCIQEKFMPSTDIGGGISVLPKSLRDGAYRHDAFCFSQMMASWSTLLLVGITGCPAALEYVTT